MKLLKQILLEVGANLGTMGSGDGEVISGANLVSSAKQRKIDKARKEQKRYSSFKKQRAEREKERQEAFRQKDISAKHFGEDCGSTGMPGNWGGGTSADAMSFKKLPYRTKRNKKIRKMVEEFSKKVTQTIEAAKERDKKDKKGLDSYRKTLENKNINKKEGN